MPPVNGTAEKVLVLIQLHDVLAWSGIGHDSVPGLDLTFELTVHVTAFRV